MDQLRNFVGKRVSITTVDGRHLLGMLRGLDDIFNAVMSECVERIYNVDKEPMVIPFGTYMVRGDSIACVGLVDVQSEALQDVRLLRCPPLSQIA